ncbi:hypothetical protein [Desulfoferrobacter suflitae]|uniref:hypothetical protein n=1 Tax=Desulfoferrobacter suflitae TaxID=2865782 RepID=UPI002164C4BB|nr:hypothetical protein [Desulfoferrobacter suflitae]MCK8603731.1 hypothetical protein [Desulfoferrobacter suflitae]
MIKVIPVLRFVAIPAALLTVFTIYGCAGRLLLTYKGARIKQGREIPIVANKSQAGSYLIRDLTITYKYTLENEEFRIVGSVHFAGHLTCNFVGLRYFNLSIVFADQENTIINNRALVTTGSLDNICDVTFNNKLILSEAASISSFAFIYTGEAGVGGDGGRASACNFWECPIYR